MPLTERSGDRDSPPQANLSVTDDFVGFGYPTLATRSGRQHFEVTLKSGVGGVDSEGSVQLGWASVAFARTRGIFKGWSGLSMPERKLAQKIGFDSKDAWDEMKSSRDWAQLGIDAQDAALELGFTEHLWNLLAAMTKDAQDGSKGCGADCKASHSGDGDCLVCGRSWGAHSGHTCQEKTRGSWAAKTDDGDGRSEEDMERQREEISKQLEQLRSPEEQTFRHAWLVDGVQRKRWFNHVVKDFGGERWVDGDVISIGVDLQQGKMYIARNGGEYRIESIAALDRAMPAVYPVIFAAEGVRLMVNLGARPFRYPAPDSLFKPLAPSATLDDLEMIRGRISVWMSCGKHPLGCVKLCPTYAHFPRGCELWICDRIGYHY